MHSDLDTTVAFTGHRTYDGTADARLRTTVRELYARGCRTFLCGMAVGFDLAAAEAVLDCRAGMPGLRLVAVIPFTGQERHFPAADSERFRRVCEAADERIVLSPGYHPGCYAVRNNYLTDHCSVVVAWYDGSPGGTHYTVHRALKRGLELIDLHPAPPLLLTAEPTLF